MSKQLSFNWLSGTWDSKGSDEVCAFSKQQMMSSHCDLQISYRWQNVRWAVLWLLICDILLCGCVFCANSLIRGANAAISSIDCDVKTVLFLAWAFILSFTSFLIVVDIVQFPLFCLCLCAGVCLSIFHCSTVCVAFPRIVEHVKASLCGTAGSLASTSSSTSSSKKTHCLFLPLL